MTLRRRSEIKHEPRPESPPAAPRPAARSPGVVQVPHDPINEIVLLAAVIVDAEAAAYCLANVPADAFFGKGHAEAWAVLQEIHRRKLAYDPATVRQLSGGAVDAELLEQYARERPRPPANLRHHVDVLQWDRVRIEAVRGPVTQFLEALRDPTASPERVRALAKRIDQSFAGMGALRYLRDPNVLLREQTAELGERRAGRAVFPYGLKGLDEYEDGRPRLIPGAAPGKLTVVTGVSGSGKTTMTARIAVAHANLQRRVLFGAWEQGAGMTLELCATLSLNWSRTSVSTGDYSAEEQRELAAEMERLSEFIRFFELPFGRSRGDRGGNDRNLDLIQQYIADVAPDLFVADLFRRALKETDPDDEEQAIYRMQAITQEQRCHTLLVQQLRLKDLEQREDKRPTREAIKGSSGWVEAPDTILAWHRPALFKNVPDDILQAIVLKQRYGPWPLALEFEWEPERGWIGEARSIDYDRPGERTEGGLDSFLGESVRRGQKGGGGRSAR